LTTIEAAMSRPGFWDNRANAAKQAERAGGLREELNIWNTLLQAIDDLATLAASTSDDDAMAAEVEGEYKKLLVQFQALEFSTLFQGRYDERNAIVAIHAGSGGTEAQDWAEMLLRMYLRFAERHALTARIIDEHRGQEAGIKTVTVHFHGRYAYGYLKGEHGVHRLVRISPFDAEKMRHTSFALVEVLPELEEIEEQVIDPKDLRVDTFLSSGHGGQSVNTTYSAVRIVHIPTGITVSCQNERSQQQNRETALKILQAKLHRVAVAEQAEERQELRGEFQSAEWGSQARSYVLQPYRLVKDHRTGFETSDTDAVLDGKFESFVEAYLKWEVEKRQRLAKK
jgi:peptide chain release factor 2